MNTTIIDMFTVDCDEAIEGRRCNNCDSDLELYIERASARRIEGVTTCPNGCGPQEYIAFDIVVVINS